MKIINVAQVMEVVDLHGCGDWGQVDVSLTDNGLRVAIGRDLFVLPVRDGMATATDAVLLEWIDDMGF